MRNPAILLAALALTAPALALSGAGLRRPVEITYLGNAGWQISDGKRFAGRRSRPPADIQPANNR